MAQDELEDIFGTEIEVGADPNLGSGQSGSSGSNGSSGSDGSNGSNGSSGSSGSDGSDGSNGSSGSSGSNGSDGSNGSNGSSGSSGSDGSDGSNGSSGSSGSDGSDGEPILIECLSYAFIADLIPEGKDFVPTSLFNLDWFFPKNMFNETIYETLKWFMRGIRKEDGIWYFTEEFLIDNYSGNTTEEENGYLELKEIDAKMLKYTILKIKNNPQYFQPDGYKYFYYDKLYNVFKTLIVEKTPIVFEDCFLYGLSDNLIQIHGGNFKYGSLIKIEDGYFDILRNNTNPYANGLKYLGLINDELKSENDMKFITNDVIFEKMLGFVRILEQ